MSFTNQTTHYGLPQWIGSDKPTYLVDQNNAYQTIDSELYNANTTAGAAQTAAEGAVQTAGAASSTAASAVETAQAAQTTASGADTKADTAISQAQAAQTAAGAAQAAAQAAQEAAAGNSITNLAPAYDPTITYLVGALVTQAGKLYECIVAVETPEQFDINKWDDKTTSEVYARVGSGGDVYTKTEADALFESQTHASSTYETKANVTAKTNLKLSTDATKQIRFGIDGNGNYGYIKNGENTVNPFRSGSTLNKFGIVCDHHGGCVLPIDILQGYTTLNLATSGGFDSYSLRGYTGDITTGATSTQIMTLSSGNNTLPTSSTLSQYTYFAVSGLGSGSSTGSSTLKIVITLS